MTTTNEKTPAATSTVPQCESSGPWQSANAADLLRLWIGSEREQFLTAYNPDRLAIFAGDVERCHFGQAPTLELANSAYGSETAGMWWTLQLAALNRISGAQDKMSEEQLGWTATALAVETTDLKVTECMLFLWRLRTQKYGRFYRQIDPDTILRALQVFRQERQEARQRRIQQEEDERRRLEDARRASEDMTLEEAEAIVGPLNNINALHS